jgi:hypothetical protein
MVTEKEQSIAASRVRRNERMRVNAEKFRDQLPALSEDSSRYNQAAHRKANLRVTKAQRIALQDGTTGARSERASRRF